MRPNEPLLRKDVEMNRLLVEKEFFAIIKKENRMPTYMEIANGTGLSLSSVKRHMEAIDLSDRTKHVRAATDRVIMGLTQAAMSGQWQSVKLWMQLVHGWSERRQLDVNVSQQQEPETEEQILARINAILYPNGNIGTIQLTDSRATEGA